MGSKNLRVIVTRKLPEPVEKRLAELFNVTLNPDDVPMSRDALATALSSANVVVPTLNDRIDAEMLQHAGPDLKLIASYGTGFDHIDVAAAHARGICVTNTPGVLSEDTADMAMALILAVPRRLKEGVALAQGDAWQGWAPTALLGRRIGGKQLGLLGMGWIGQAVAARALGFGLRLNYHTRRRLHPELEDRFSATWWQSLDQMLAHIDILCVCVPHTPSTFHIMNARRLALMKPSAYLVNTSRGEVVDENALTRQLRSGALAGAGLDVFENGHHINPRLKDLPNALLLPHMSSATEEARLEMGGKVMINIQTFADGHRPPDLVLPDQI